jgi:hypothetical protein
VQQADFANLIRRYLCLRRDVCPVPHHILHILAPGCPPQVLTGPTAPVTATVRGLKAARSLTVPPDADKDMYPKRLLSDP